MDVSDSHTRISSKVCASVRCILDIGARNNTCTYCCRWGARLWSALWLQRPSPVPSRPLLPPGTLTPLQSLLVLVQPLWVWPAQGLGLGLCSAPWSLGMPVTPPWSSSSSLTPFLGLPCLRPWVCSVSWWPSCYSLLSKCVTCVPWWRWLLPPPPAAVLSSLENHPTPSGLRRTSYLCKGVGGFSGVTGHFPGDQEALDVYKD